MSFRTIIDVLFHLVLAIGSPNLTRPGKSETKLQNESGNKRGLISGPTVNLLFRKRTISTQSWHSLNGPRLRTVPEAEGDLCAGSG